MSAYWPWWAGSLALAGVTVFYTVITGRTFGVSGAWDRALHWREERELERLDSQFADDGDLEAALAAATAAEFGTVAGTAPDPGNAGAPGPADPVEPVTAAVPATRPGVSVVRPRMFTFQDLRMLLAFAGAVALIVVAFLAIRLQRLTGRIHAGVVPGAVLFGTGWAISGGCPAIPLVQLASGYLPALITIGGVATGMRLSRWANARYFRLDRGACGL